MNSKRILKIVLIPVLIIVSCNALNFLLSFPKTIAQEQYWNEKAQEIEYRRQLWVEQKITKYKIGKREFSMDNPDGCLDEYIVNNNTIEDTVASECPFPYAAVDDLFFLIADSYEFRRCGANSCECDGPIILKAVYDEIYKFPKRIWTDYDPQERWRFQTIKWEDLLHFVIPVVGKKFCTLLGDGGGTRVEIETFLPLK